MKVELESNLHTQASTRRSRLTYFGVLLICPECGAVYSPELFKCPSCGDRILGRERDELLRRVKAERIVDALKKSRLRPGEMYFEIYRRREKVYKNPSLKNSFAEEVLRQLVFNGFIRPGEFDFVVLKQPSVDEVYDILWGKKAQSEKKVERKPERKQAGYIYAVKEGDRWIQKIVRRAGAACARFFSLNSPESVEYAIMITKQNPGVKYNFEFTNEYRPTLERVDHLLSEVPNVGIIACSEWTWWNRLRVGLSGLLKILVRPKGGVKKWVNDVRYYARELLQIGENLGEVCKKLNAFNIKISVEGLLRWHWKEIRPPPGSTW